MRTIPLMFALTVTGLSLTAQSFDAASIRVTRESLFGTGLIGLQPGRLVANESTVVELASIAFGVTDNRVVDGPGWARSTRYSITATITGETTRERAQAMLRQLLADRFALKTRREPRELPVYALTLARRDGSLGPKLRRAGPTCAPITPSTVDGANVPPPPPPPPGGSGGMRPLVAREVKLRCPSMFFPGGLSARAVTIDELMFGLSRFLARPVVDRTGLAGEFDVDLAYQYELAAAGPGAVAAGPSVFTAVQDQLGLKLEPVRAPFDVVVIENVAQPSEN